MAIFCKGFKAAVWALAVITAIGAASGSALAAPQVAFPGEASGEMARTPLMIIRFNQRRVYFERSLYMVVSKAVEAKPGVMFDLVSVVPGVEHGAQTAESNLANVLNSLSEMGVPRSRISVSRKENASIENSEVHLFVR